MHPDRIVIGAQSEHAVDLMKKVYEPFMAPILVTDINSAELIKHAANSFLALKISYINAVSAICEASGADVEKVADGIGMDRRIGRTFLNAGIGYGGSCFPKDIAAFITISEQLGVPFNLLKEVQRINTMQKERFLKAIRETLWVLRDKKIAVWGLTFKPDTDDTRSSVAIDLVTDMIREGAHVMAYDPKGMPKARDVKEIAAVKLASSALDAVEGAEALIIATEWSEFANVDLAVVKEKMTTPIVFDGRNLFDPETMAQLGLPLSFDRAGERHAALNFVPLSARETALVALRTWQTYEARADFVISKILSETKLSTSDRAFTLELFYGVLRNLTLLDFWIRCLRPSPLDVDLRDILRLGLYQLLLLVTPDHAAVNESVELAPAKRRGLINGMLRGAARTRDELRTRAAAQPLSIRASHPEFLISRWHNHFGGKATAALCAWNNQPPPVYARINRLKIDCEQFTQRYPDSQPLPRNRAFVAVANFPADALQRGHCYIQDPSTAIASQLLDPQPGEKILDACAAPGGKTSHLAELMQNRGVIVACDREARRIGVLEENIRRLGIGIARVYRHDWMQTSNSEGN